MSRPRVNRGRRNSPTMGYVMPAGPLWRRTGSPSSQTYGGFPGGGPASAIPAAGSYNPYDQSTWSEKGNYHTSGIPTPPIPETTSGGLFGRLTDSAAKTFSGPQPTPQPRKPTLIEQAIADAQNGKLDTAKYIREAAARHAAAQIANTEQHIADQRSWGNTAVGQIGAAGRTNAGQNRSYMNQMTGNATKMLKAAGVKGSPIGQLGGINAAEMGANAQADTGWFNRQSAEQSKLNAFYGNALRRQANAQEYLAKQDVLAKTAEARNADIQNKISLGTLQQQQLAQNDAGGLDPNAVQGQLIDTLKTTNGNVPAAIGILMRNYNPNNPQQRRARAILEAYNTFYKNNPEVAQQVIASK